MPYIGHSPTNAGSFTLIDDIASGFNGSTTAFTMQVGSVDVTPKADSLLITIDGVVQHTPEAYTVSGSTINFTSAPDSTADFYGIIMGQSASVGQGTIGADELKVSGDGTSLQVLTSDGDGTFSWLSQSSITAPAGSLLGSTLASGVTASSLTSVGTIGTGVWQGTKVASDYLDDDTAHLSGTQTFSGAKTFTNDYTVLDNTAQMGLKMYTDDTAVLYVYDKSEDAVKGRIMYEGTASGGANRWLFRTNASSTNALILDSSSNATFAGSVLGTTLLIDGSSATTNIIRPNTTSEQLTLGSGYQNYSINLAGGDQLNCYTNGLTGGSTSGTLNINYAGGSVNLCQGAVLVTHGSSGTATFGGDVTITGADKKLLVSTSSSAHLGVSTSDDSDTAYMTISASDAYAGWARSGTIILYGKEAGGRLTLIGGSGTDGEIQMETGGSNTLVLDTDKSATFAGSINKVWRKTYTGNAGASGSGNVTISLSDFGIGSGNVYYARLYGGYYGNGRTGSGVFEYLIAGYSDHLNSGTYTIKEVVDHSTQSDASTTLTASSGTLTLTVTNNDSSQGKQFGFCFETSSNI